MKALLTLLAVSLAATALAASAPARLSPAATDTPSVAASQGYVPFVTDFPSRAPEAAPAGVESHGTGGSDEVAAAVGVALVLALGALAAASLPSLRRRRSLSSV